MHKITIHQEVIEFFRSYGTITNNEGNDEFKAPNWIFKHIELNEFEIIFPSKQERFFYISYNGEVEVPAKDFMFSGSEKIGMYNTKTIIGHLAFSHLGYPSLLYITEQLIPDQCKQRGTPQPTNIVLSFFIEFKTEQDFDDFTIGRNMGEQMEGFKLN